MRLKQRGFTVFEIVIWLALFVALSVGVVIYENYNPRPLSADELNGLKALAETSCSGSKAVKAALAEKTQFSPHELGKLRRDLDRAAAEEVRAGILGKKEKASCD